MKKWWRKSLQSLCRLCSWILLRFPCLSLPSSFSLFFPFPSLPREMTRAFSRAEPVWAALDSYSVVGTSCDLCRRDKHKHLRTMESTHAFVTIAQAFLWFLSKAQGTHLVAKHVPFPALRQPPHSVPLSGSSVQQLGLHDICFSKKEPRNSTVHPFVSFTYQIS